MPTRLVGSGVLIVVAGLIGALAAKRSAEIASFVASQPTRLMSDPSNPIGVILDPSSAHHVPPDYTVFWLGILVVALGAIVVSAGIGVGLATRRRA
jgi:hypothetical protein